MYRKIAKVIQGRRAIDGAGVHLVRVFGYNEVKDFDPFLMLDAFDSENSDDYIKGFPWHPHRGIETITYLIEGEIEHGDNLGNRGVIKGGEVQWMTAGSGVIHQEMPQASPRLLGAQLWLNLPAKDKMTAPKYNDIRAADMPVKEVPGGKIRVISGHYQGVAGAFQGAHVDALYLDVDLAPQQELILETPADTTAFIYIVAGRAQLEEGGEVIAEKQAILFGAGDQIIVNTKEDSARLLVLAGAPLKEPIAWGGPVVMNTEEELNQAFLEIDQGNFIK